MAPRWPKRAPRRAQERPKTGPRAPKIAPRAAQEGPKRRLFGPRRRYNNKCSPLFCSMASKMAPRGLPDPPEEPHKGPKTPQKSPKSAPREPQESPSRLPPPFLGMGWWGCAKRKELQPSRECKTIALVKCSVHANSKTAKLEIAKKLQNICKTFANCNGRNLEFAKHTNFCKFPFLPAGWEIAKQMQNKCKTFAPPTRTLRTLGLKRVASRANAHALCHCLRHHGRETTAGRPRAGDRGRETTAEPPRPGDHGRETTAGRPRPGHRFRASQATHPP